MKPNFRNCFLEICLLDSAYQRSGSSSRDPPIDAAKRYRLDTEKIAKAVAVAEAFALSQKERKAAAAKKTATEPPASPAQPSG